MARARLLKPSFFTNDRLAELPPVGRILFAGLWCIADREGRLEDRPARIKAEVLPYDRANVDALLQGLADAGFIERYESGGHKYIQVLAFAKHQSPHMREPASTIPAPGQHSAEPAISGTGPAVTPFPFPVTGNPIPVENGAKAPRLARKPLTSEQHERLRTDYAALGDVDERIAVARSHVASKKHTDEYLYLRNWLRTDLERMKPNGRTATPGDSAAELAERERLRRAGVLS